MNTLTNLSNTPLNEEGDDEEDMAGVLRALLELHQLDIRNNSLASYDNDRATIERAIELNEKLQQQVNIQIALIDSKLHSNAKTMTEARYSGNAENRFGQRIYLHREYENKVDYFDKSELKEVEEENVWQLSANKEPGEEDSFNGEEENEEEEEEEEEEDDDTGADSEKKLPNKAWSRKERQKLTAGILSEARRIIAYDHLKKGEGWRVWDVEKIDKETLENFPVSRLDWNRISTIHVHSRTANQCLMQWTTQEHPIINKKPWSKQESEQLAQLVEKIGHGQWEKIATDLGTSRTISQCFSHYMADKNYKSARALKWTPEEDKKLALAVKVFGNCNWQQVAAMLKGRTGQQCLQRWEKSINPAIKRSRWTPEESEQLKRAVQLYGAGNWAKIQRLLPGRTDMQCRERYVNVSQPSVNKNKITEEELTQLVALVEQIGPKWSYIATFFPGRTDNFVFRQYHAYEKKLAANKAREGDDAEDSTSSEKRKSTPKNKRAPKKAGQSSKPATKTTRGRKRKADSNSIPSTPASNTEDEVPVERETVNKRKRSKIVECREKEEEEQDSEEEAKEEEESSEDEYKPPPAKITNNARRVLTRRQKQQQL